MSVGGIRAWLAEVRRLGWKRTWPLALSAGFLLVYVLITQNPIPLLVAMALGWVTHRFADRVDERLQPLWPLRVWLPRKAPMVLAWLAPMAIAFYITGSPQLFSMMSWLPGIGPDASLFVFLTVISAFVAYLLIREPKRGVAR